MVIDPAFWRDRRVFLTGHTGFKGSWASLVLSCMGAKVFGFALPPEDDNGLFIQANVDRALSHEIGDVRDAAAVRQAVCKAEPDIVIHMAAQALVRASYAQPVETYETNVMGTVHVLDAVRHAKCVRAVIVVTSDKCYENREWPWGYREIDRYGGHDPYSNSKGCAELVTEAYRSSFFRGEECLVASVRAGNVIGGGDWSRDRLVPDAMRAFLANEVLRIRNPRAVRPWQHVLDPVLGYLLLAERLATGENDFASGWNFGPDPSSEVSVGAIVEHLVRLWGPGARWEQDIGDHPHEANYLKLDCSKARSKLGWTPAFCLDQALTLTLDWYRSFARRENIRAITIRQIEESLGVVGGAD